MIRKKDGKISPLKLILTIILSIIIITAAFFGGVVVDRLVLNRQLSSLSWAKSIIDKYYLYDYEYDMNEQMLDGLVAGLDRYSAYYTAEEYAKEIADRMGQKSGIGVNMTEGKDGGVLFVRVVGNSPAWHAGLRNGDTVVSGIYKGQEQIFDTEPTQKFIDFLDPIEEGEEFSLKLSDDREVTLCKADYVASYAYMSTNSQSWQFEGETKLELAEKTDEQMDFLPDGYGYISLSQFYGEAVTQMYLLLNEFKQNELSTLIFDLRNNGGGSLGVMNGISGLFLQPSLEKKVSTSITYKNGKSEIEYCMQISESCLNEDTEVYVLANSGSASASEALLGVLISYGVVDYDNIILSDYSNDYLQYLKNNGSEAKTATTYGKGIMQSTYLYATGEALKLTVAQLYWPNGKTIHGVGITAADGCKTVSADWVATVGDSELRSAIALMN